DRGVGRRKRLDRPVRQRLGELRRQGGVHEQAGPVLPRGRRGGGRRLGGGGVLVLVPERACESHHRGELRDQRLHDRGVGRRKRLDLPVRQRLGELRRQGGVYDRG